MSSIEVQKFTRHTLKAMEYLSLGVSEAEIPLVHIIERVKHQTRHLKPVSNMIASVRNSLRNLHHLGLVKQTGRFLFRMVKPHTISTSPPPSPTKRVNKKSDLYQERSPMSEQATPGSPPMKHQKRPQSNPEQPPTFGKKMTIKVKNLCPADLDGFFQRVRPSAQGKPMTYHPPRKSVVTKTSSTQHPFSQRNPNNGRSLESDSLYRIHLPPPGTPLGHINPANRNAPREDDKTSSGRTSLKDGTQRQHKHSNSKRKDRSKN